MGLFGFGKEAPLEASKARKKYMDACAQWLTVIPEKSQREVLREAILEIKKRFDTIPDALQEIYADKIIVLQKGLETCEQFAPAAPTNPEAKKLAENARQQMLLTVNSLLNYEKKIQERLRAKAA